MFWPWICGQGWSPPVLPSTDWRWNAFGRIWSHTGWFHCQDYFLDVLPKKSLSKNTIYCPSSWSFDFCGPELNCLIETLLFLYAAKLLSAGTHSSPWFGLVSCFQLPEYALILPARSFANARLSFRHNPSYWRHSFGLFPQAPLFCPSTDFFLVLPLSWATRTPPCSRIADFINL